MMTIFQRCRRYYTPKSLCIVHNYYPLVKSSHGHCQTMALSSFERRRMQSVFDTTSSQQLLPSQISPWLLLTPELTFHGIITVSKVVYQFYDVGADQVMSFEGDKGVHLQLHSRGRRSDAFKGSSHGWLAEFDSWTRDFFLYNPISRRRLKLPTMDTLPLRGSPGEGAIDFKDTGKLSECIVKKVILSSSDPENDDSCVAMMLYGADNRLACCHPARGGGGQWYPLGSRHWEWDKDGKRRARSYQDIAYSAREKLFFCITKDGDELEAWDSMALLAHDMPISIKDYFEDGRRVPWPRRCEREFYLKGMCSRYRERYLVAYDHHHGGSSSSQLFLVLRHKIRLMGGGAYYGDDYEGWELEYSNDKPLQTVAFDVCKFDVEKRELVHMDRTLDGLALFVGKNHSFALKADEFHGLKPNSIYFTDSEPQDNPKLPSPNEYGGHDNGVYNYQDGTFSSCYYSCEDESYQRMVPAPMWFSPIDHN